MTSSSSISSMNTNIVFLALRFRDSLGTNQSSSGSASVPTHTRSARGEIGRDGRQCCDTDLQGALDKTKKTPPALASDSIAKLSQLRQEATELAAQIEDFQREAAQLQKRGQRLQGRLVGAERESLKTLASIPTSTHRMTDSSQ